MSLKRARSNEDDNFNNAKKSKQDDANLPIHSLNCRNHSNFDKKFPNFRQPSEIGSFSLDINRRFDHSDNQLKAYVKPPNYDNVHFDLRQGYSTMIRKDESKKEYINDILKWILKNQAKFALQSNRTDDLEKTKRQLYTDFICWRGLLTKFLCTPYENREGWCVAITLYNGTYYLCEYDTEEKKQHTLNRTERDEEMCCWGWKFEQYLTGDSLTSVPDTDKPYNNCEAFCTVVRSRLNTHSLVFSGEVDAVHTDTVQGKDAVHTDTVQGKHYVELKTCRDFTHPRQYTSFKRYKLIKWWAQSFLVGIPEIICGYRDDDGIVHRLQSYNTQKLPDIAKDIPNTWRPNICFNFLDQLLSFIKSVVKTDDSSVVHLLEWSPGKPVICSKPLRDSDYNFLPQWYTDV